MQINEAKVGQVREEFLKVAREAGSNPELQKILAGWQLVQEMFLARNPKHPDPNVHSVMLDIRDGRKPGTSQAALARLHLGAQVEGKPGNFITEVMSPEDQAVLTSFIQALHKSLQLSS
jgi:hypothetical protein